MAKEPKKSEEVAEAPPVLADPRRPIGVPDYYIAPPPLPRSLGRAVGAEDFDVTTAFPVPPRYFVGYEWTPASLPAEDIARLQRKMVEAGLISKRQRFQLGTWDETTRAAYTHLLSFANATGLDETQALLRYGEGQGQFGPTRDPLTVEMTSPATLRRIVDKGAREVLGRRLTTEETASLVSAYQAQEQAAQEAAYATAEEGGMVTAAPDPVSFAEEEIRRRHPGESGAADIADQGNEFFQLLRSVGAYGS